MLKEVIYIGDILHRYISRLDGYFLQEAMVEEDIKEKKRVIAVELFKLILLQLFDAYATFDHTQHDQYDRAYFEQLEDTFNWRLVSMLKDLIPAITKASYDRINGVLFMQNLTVVDIHASDKFGFLIIELR